MTDLPPDTTDPSSTNRSTQNDSKPRGDTDRHVLQDVVSSTAGLSPIGVDTVRLLVEDFDLGKAPDLTLQEHTDLATGETQQSHLGTTEDDVTVRGSGAFSNTGLARVSLKDEDRLIVEASLPRVLNGNNLRPVSSTSQLSDALTKLEDHLEEHGLSCRLDGCPIYRLDVCRNVPTSAPISDYEHALSHQSVPYLTSRDHGHPGVKWVSSQGGTTSSQREITFYSKSDEADLVTPRVQRFEYRLQRRRAVRRHVGDISTADLQKDFTPVRELFRGIVRDLFPTPDADSSRTRPKDGRSPTAVPTADDLEPVIEEIRDEHGPNCHLLNRLAWVLLYALHGKPDRLLQMLQRVMASDAGPSNGKYQVQRKTREARRHAQHLDEGVATDRERLIQLRAKLLAEPESISME